MTLIDSNVVIDILARDPTWFEWSFEALNKQAAQRALFVDEVVYSEIAVHSANEIALDQSLRDIDLQFQAIPKSALFLAGKVFGRYRSAGGTRTSNLPDFFIGAHAQIVGLPILTRDVRRYRTYFPDVALITPDV
ncbi:MAG: type II toxin-antitoxin system VapC family toxin [Rhizomicrobium sp.]